MSYKCMPGMIDNHIVKDDHQQGIERVKQRKHERMDVEGHSGKMGGHHDKSHFNRKGDSLTPRKA